MSGTASSPGGAETLTVDYSREKGRPRSAYLLVIEEGSSSVFQLPPSGEVIIGRSPEAHLRVRDSTASRRHARLGISRGEITITDLGSHNGTRVNGDLLRGPRRLASSDVISICDVTLLFLQKGGAHSMRPLLDLGLFRQRLDEELLRALTYNRELALGAIELPARLGQEQATLALSGKLRLIDVAAWGRKGEVLLLIPELTPDEVTEILEAVMEALRGAGQEGRCGLALCPQDGADADTLLASARAACASALPGGVQAAQELPTTLLVGQTEVVLADEVMVRLYDLMRRIAQSKLPVLISGETGTGKELAASAIHHFSPRREGRLITLNCAALPDTLAESELFGHEKGAFSGADRSRPGHFESAHEGSLFLDEVGELSLAVQAKLLRVLEQGSLMRLGSTKERQVDVRLIAATNRNLEEEVKAGRFRQDLFFRLSTATLVLPPLRDRKRELPILARRFLQTACHKAGREPLAISTEAMHLLLGHEWPGNVRELKNLMEFVATTAQGPEVLGCHLPPHMRREEGQAEDRGGGTQVEAKEGPRRFRPLEEELRELERTRIIEALKEANGFQNRAAELLSMPLRTFAYKVKLYGLQKRQQKPGT